MSPDDTAFVLPPPPVSCNCPLIYRPVCGTDGQTYSNDCVLRCVSAENVSNGRPPIYINRLGECPQENCICPTVVLPVCGTDGNTYSNECNLVCENRRRQKLGLAPIYIASRSACPLPPCYCSGVIILVCGTDGKSYRNICFLQCATRRNQAQGYPPIFYQSTGLCPQEACSCFPNKDPVCASDGKTYDNECFLQCENHRRNVLGLYPLVIKNKGPCSVCTCPKIEDPVCASDDRTYRNPCLLACENDLRKKFGLPPLTIKYKGICGCNCASNPDPVCGSDDVTYNNICLLRCESLKREYQGLPPISLSYGGPCLCNCRNCSFLYQLVCGSDNRTYWNSCWLNCYSQCNEKKGLPKIIQVKYGYC